MPRRKIGKVGTPAEVPTSRREPAPPRNHARRAKVAILLAAGAALFLSGVLLALEVLGDGCRVVRARELADGVRLELLQCRGARQLRLTAPEDARLPQPPPPSPRELEAMR